MFGKKDKTNSEEIKNKNFEAEEDKDLQQDETAENSSNEVQEEAKEENDEEAKNKEGKNELEEENKKLKETLMRTLAELDNTRRRSAEENEKTAKYAISRFAEDLIPVMEDFYLAFDSLKDANLSDEKVAKNFFDGIKLTQNELKKVFDKNGLVRLFPLDEDFNPDLHNAIVQIESDGEEGKIVQVMQAGYKIKDRLLRPALVGVSKPKA